jgi:U3 small nucleolar RNA-associated protein 7
VHKCIWQRCCLPLSPCLPPHSQPSHPTPSNFALQITDRKLQGRLRYSEGVFRDAQTRAAKANDWLLPDDDAGALEAEGMERTWRFGQEEIVAAVAAGAQSKAFDLRLEELGPYNIDFTRSGRHMLLGGRKGHLALMDWQRAQLVCEVQVRVGWGKGG